VCKYYFFHIKNIGEAFWEVIAANAQLVRADTIGNPENSDEFIGHIR